MSSIEKIRQLLERFTKRHAEQKTPTGTMAALDGLSALSLTEAEIADVLVETGLSVKRETNVNTFDRPVSIWSARDGRATLGGAIGASASGLRATAVVDSAGLLAAQDLLTSASTQHLPLITHLICRTASASAGPEHSSHEAYYALAQSGALQLFAINAQEAIDLALIARRTAERALLPGLVAIDSEETATSVQTVTLPHRELLQQFVGSPADDIETPTAAQNIIFGERRKRVPAWYDLDEPALLGGQLGNSGGWTQAGQRPFFSSDHLASIFAESCEQFAQLSGRHYAALALHNVDKAKVVFVVQGALAELASTVADALQEQAKIPVGVIGLRCLRPFPTAALLNHLRGKEQVWVIERGDQPLAADPPLLNEIRSTMAQALVPKPQRTERDASLPEWRSKDHPSLGSAIAGLSNSRDQAMALFELVRQSPTDRRSTVYLGTKVATKSQDYPHRDALIDQVTQSYPDASRLGHLAAASNSTRTALDLPSERAFTLTTLQRADAKEPLLLTELAELWQRSAGGLLRGARREMNATYAVACDQLTHLRTNDPQKDEAALLAVDPGFPRATHLLALWGETALACIDQVPPLAEGVCVLWQGDVRALERYLPAKLRQALDQANARYFCLANKDEPSDQPPPSEVLAAHLLTAERRLGALIATLFSAEQVNLTSARLRSLRAEQLAPLSVTERDARLEALQAGFSATAPSDVDMAPVVTAEEDAAVPAVLKQLSSKSRRERQDFRSLARFWNQVGALSEAGDWQQLSADPCLTTGMMPPLSASFQTYGRAGNNLPELYSQRCTGCSYCYTTCPDGAIAATTLTPRSLLERGMELAKEAGSSAEALRMLVPKLANAANKQLKKSDGQPATAEALFRPLFDATLAKGNVPSERTEAIEQAFTATMSSVGKLPIAVTDPFFREPVAENAAEGELFSLVINPDACKQCGLCITVCEPQALSQQQLTHAALQEARTLWQTHAALPDTSGATIARVKEGGNVPLLGALLLSQHLNAAMSSGDHAEPGSGAKIGLRLLVATAEYQRQQTTQTLHRRLTGLREQIGTRIRDLLAGALPTDDLARLAGGLQSLDQTNIKLSELARHVEGATGSTQMSLTKLRRLTSIGEQLADLDWRLMNGSQGLGRARLGLVMTRDPSLQGLVEFPHNPFQVPAVVQSGESALAVAQGLLQGQARVHCELVSTFRRAEKELQNPTEAALVEAKLKQLSYAELSEEEGALSTPLIVCGAAVEFSDQVLQALLATRMPVKVILFTDGAEDLGTHNQTAIYSNLALLSLSGANAFVAQVSLAALDHLANTVTHAFRHAGPAIIRVHVPSPTLHGFASDQTLRQAEDALHSRAVPLFVLDPTGRGVFGSRLSLEGNPKRDQLWATNQTGEELTPADWLVTQQRFAHLFTPLAEQTAAIPLRDYLDMAATERADKVPFILKRHPNTGTHGATNQSATERLRPAPEVIAASERRLNSWRMLQELAGLITPFTEQIWQEAKTAVADAHTAEVQALKADHERTLAELEQTHTAHIAARVRDQLLALAGYQQQAGADQSASSPADQEHPA